MFKEKDFWWMLRIFGMTPAKLPRWRHMTPAKSNNFKKITILEDFEHFCIEYDFLKEDHKNNFHTKN